MKKFSLFASFFVAIALTSSAMAAGYGAAGCGFGSMVITENKKLHQVGAWFLNAIFGNQTFGMTSGTSNCGESGIVLAEKEQKVFVETNFQSLTKEMASGEGEDLNTLASLLGCPLNQTSAFGTFTQANFTSLFPSGGTSPSQMLSSLKARMASDEHFGQTCHNIGS